MIRLVMFVYLVISLFIISKQIEDINDKLDVVIEQNAELLSIYEQEIR